MIEMRPEILALARAAGVEPEAASRLLTLLGHERPSFATVPGAEPSLGETWATHLGGAEPSGAADTRAQDPGERYEDQGMLGSGASGEVRRVFDRQLGRSVAMKILSTEARTDERRFLEEARTIARLQHPGILPVHEIGRLPDGRVFFTMQEIRGQTLREQIRKVHLAAVDHWGTTPDGWTLHRLIAAFHATCEAVAYAHGEGVVHRDLKPQNVMIGEHGEVLVVDWGLARPTGSENPPGRVVGTPAYLAPELLRADPPAVDPRADVYALGAILFVLLTNRVPFDGPDPRAVIEAVRQGPAPVPRAHLPVPDPLIEICMRAMAREPSARIGHAGVLAVAVRTWLDGAHKREEALTLVAQAEASLPEAAWLRERAAGVEAAVREELAAIAPHLPEQVRYPAWDRLEEAAALRERAELREDEAELVLQGALTIDPNLPEAHAALAQRGVERFEAAQRAHDRPAAARALARVRRHVDSLPPQHPMREGLLCWLRGDATLDLDSEPAGAEVRLFRVVERHRRLVLEGGQHLGRTPLRERRVPPDSLVLELAAPGRQTTRLPLRLPRGGRADLRAPGEAEPRPVLLPPPLPEGEVYVPAGWCGVGGDRVAFGSAVRRRIWVDGFVMRRDPISNREYIAFLDDLVARGEEERALALAPRERGGTHGEVGPVIYGRDERGRFVLREDMHGDLWDPDWPVIMVDWCGAMAYAAWWAARTGLPWRLPCEWEWEKAARGVDERPYPWGHAFDPSRACTRLSHAGRPLPARIGEGFEVDVSVYGVRGLAGNVRDWCLDRYAELPPDEGSRVEVPSPELELERTGPRVNRGGFWLGNERDARAADRHFHPPEHRAAELGFRLARSWPEGRA